MNYLSLKNISFFLILLALSFTACQRENMDELLSNDTDALEKPQLVDVTGRVNLSNGTATSYYAYLSSCPVDDFFLHTLIYAEDFSYEGGLLKPIGAVNQIYWITFEELNSGSFKAYGSIVGVDASINDQRFIVDLEINEITSTGSGSGVIISYSGSFYPNPTYNSTGAEINQLAGDFNVFKVPCELDDIEPSILTLPNGDKTEWAIGRSEFTIDGVTHKYSSVIQYCQEDEDGISTTGTYIHFGNGITNYTQGPAPLAISGEFLIYFSQQGTQNTSESVEAVLIAVSPELILNFSPEYLQQNGISIVLNFSFINEERAIGDFMVEDISSADWGSISSTFNIRVIPCN